MIETGLNDKSVDEQLDWALKQLDYMAGRLRGLGYVSQTHEAERGYDDPPRYMICIDCHAEANKDHEAGCNLGYWYQQAERAAELLQSRKNARYEAMRAEQPKDEGIEGEGSGKKESAQNE